MKFDTTQQAYKYAQDKSLKVREHITAKGKTHLNVTDKDGHPMTLSVKEKGA